MKQRLCRGWEHHKYTTFKVADGFLTRTVRCLACDYQTESSAPLARCLDDMPDKEIENADTE